MQRTPEHRSREACFVRSSTETSDGGLSFQKHVCYPATDLATDGCIPSAQHTKCISTGLILVTSVISFRCYHYVDKLERILTIVHGVKTDLFMDYIHRPVSSIEHDVSETGSVSVLR
jgi:hypothetical protein